MKIDVRIQPPLRRWQTSLADQLRAAGHEVRCVVGTKGATLSFVATAALTLEERVFGPSSSLFDVVPSPTPSGRDAPDLMIALDDEILPSGDVLILFVDAERGPGALLRAVARSSTPLVQVRTQIDGREQDLVRALLAVENRDTFAHALDQVLARMVSLLLQAVRRFQRDLAPTKVQLSDPVNAYKPDPSRFVARGLARKVIRRLPGGKRGPPHWRIGFRLRDGADIRDVGDLVGADLAVVPDDRRRFYADPMPFEHDGRVYLFFEDFPYATGKGAIGLVEIRSDNTPSTPRIVLEQPFHLSYPFLVRHRGEIYMMPEMSGAGCIQLFRADPFPDRWVPDRVLLGSVVAADATPVLHDGTWWLFTTLSDDGGSSWDQLGLFHAPDLLGPWEPHRDNPVLVDAGAARPGGAMWHENGVLMRVAQDCRAGYGAGLALCRVDRLDREGYEQTVVSRFGPPAGCGADGVHTFNRTASLEVVDLRFPALRGV